MNLRHNNTFISPRASQDFKCKVTSLCYTRDSKYLGVATVDRIISIYDDRGNRVDKFHTKPNSKGRKDYLVRSIHFGPDAQNPKLVVGQTDCILFVYKWARNTDDENVWNGKKSICNKFLETSPIVSVAWQDNEPSQCIYALLEGKIKVGNLRSNQSQLLYCIESCVVSMTLNIYGTELLSGHSDGSIYKFTFQTKAFEATCSKIITHAQPPLLISWGESICVADFQSNLTFYETNGHKEQVIEEGELLELDKSGGRNNYTMISCSPNGQLLVLGSFDTFSVFKWDTLKHHWVKSVTRSIANMCSVTALAWKSNGSCIALGTSTGLLDTFNASYRHYVYKDTYDITHVSLCEVLVRKKMPNASPVILLSSYGEITRVDIYPETNSENLRYLIAKTSQSLIICDMLPFTSLEPFEILWSIGQGSDQRETFIFDAPEACIISHAGELTAVEYESKKVFGCIRTEYHSPHLISLRFYNSWMAGGTKQKEIAYLLDKQTICIRNLEKSTSFNVYHDAPIDFLELSQKGHHIIFRDEKRNLYIFDSFCKKKSLMLKRCGYTQWVPSSDVVLAQSGDTMHVYYNVNDPDQVNLCEIKGDIIDIQRQNAHGEANGKSEVIVECDSAISSYVLSEQFILFSDALQTKTFGKCVKILDMMDNSFEVQAMWNQLLDVSLKFSNTFVVERCAAAIQNSSLAKFMKELPKPSDKTGGIRTTHWKNRAKLHELERNVDEAARIYFSHNRYEEAINVYENLEMFSDAIYFGTKAQFPDSSKRKDDYTRIMVDSGKQEEAAKMMKHLGEIKQSINYYLLGGLPERAANLCYRLDYSESAELIKACTFALNNSGLYEFGGDLYTQMKNYREAIDVHLKGGFYEKAIAVALHGYPDKLRGIYEMWAERNLKVGQYGLASHIFKKGSQPTKALKAAIQANLWAYAVEVAMTLEDGQYVNAIIKELARHLISRRKFQDAEKLFVKLQDFKGLVKMYLEFKLFSEGQRISFYLTDEEMQDCYRDVAISLMEKTQFEAAEEIFIETGNWIGAVNMYRDIHRWDEALRVARCFGGQGVSENIAFSYASFLGVDCKKLDTGIMNDAIAFCVRNNDFEDAVTLARYSKSKNFVRKLLLKHACILEEEGLFLAAKTKYLEANASEDAEIVTTKHNDSGANNARKAFSMEEVAASKQSPDHHQIICEEEILGKKWRTTTREKLYGRSDILSTPVAKIE